MSSKEDNVRVVVRCRPLLSDLEQNEENVVKIDNEAQCIHANSRQFTFDYVFGADSSSDEIYSKAAKHIVDCVLQGYNGTIFAYGQTGTGKTHTSSGIMEHSFEHIFDYISNSAVDHKFLVRASFYEIYNEDIRDLLVVGKKKGPVNTSSSQSTGPIAPQHHQKTLELKESADGNVIIKDLSYFVVNNVADLKKLKAAGDRQRSMGSTKMNLRSSRSHTIFTITIEMVTTSIDATSKNDGSADGTKKTRKSLEEKSSTVRVGKFHLIDLAGSERQAKTGTTGTRLKEASKINLSLTSLSLVIAALTDPKASFVPYRNSKLTRILSDSLGGNSKTLLIACIGPARVNLEETLSTLRFASTTKNIKNKPTINEDPKDALLRRFQAQVKELRDKLQNEEDDGEDGDGQIALNKNETKPVKKVIPPELVEKLQALEAKICVGGENLIEKAEMQQKLIAESELELQKRREQEERLQQELEQRQAEILEMEESYTTLQEEIQALNRKLKKAFGFLKQSRSELDDQCVEHEKLRGNLLDSIRTAEKEIKLTNGLIQHYIPDGQLELIEQNSTFNQMTGEWELACIAYTGNNMKNDFDLNENSDSPDSSLKNYDNIYLSYSSLNL